MLPGLDPQPVGTQNGDGSQRADGQSKPADHDDQQDDDPDGPGGRREDDGHDRQSGPHDAPFVDSSFGGGGRRGYGRMS